MRFALNNAPLQPSRGSGPFGKQPLPGQQMGIHMQSAVRLRKRHIVALAGLVCWAAHSASVQPETLRLAEHLAAVQPATAADEAGAWDIPFFPAAGNAHGWQGFMRVANHSDVGGDVVVRAIDDGGRDFGTVTLALDAGETVHVNSADLEDGNAAKRLTGRIGAPGQGDWRLELTSGLRIEALAYIRTSDGFVTAMHDVAPALPAATAGEHAYLIVTSNPGSNYRQESLLRLVNPGDAEATVAILGVDDRGRSSGPVRLELAARASRTVSALELEEGASGLDGTLGDGGGKWRLFIESSTPLLAMSLLKTPTGHVTNLSTYPILPLVFVERPPSMPTPPAPEVSITSPTEVDVVWVADLEPGTSSFDVQLKYREDQWGSDSGCVKFAPDAAGQYRLTVTVDIPPDQALEAGRVLQARYRDRNESFCGSPAASPGPWSDIGEATVPEPPGGGSAGGSWGALSVDFYVSASCPGLAAGITFDHATQAAAASAARQACRQDGGSTAECNEETYVFQGCYAMSYGVEGPFCGVYEGNHPTSLSAAETDALAECRADNNTGCRIWTNRSGRRISGCNADSSGTAPPLSGQASKKTIMTTKKGT